MGVITESNGRKTVIFGTGDICIQDTKSIDGEYYNGLCFIQQDGPREIDQITDEYKGLTIDDVDAQVHFIFEKKESVMALIHSLEVIYDEMHKGDK